MTDTREHTERLARMSRQEFISSLDCELGGVELCSYMRALIAAKEMKLRDVIEALMLDVSYGYQIFNGTRIPTREILLRLAFLCEMDLPQTQQLLDMAGKPQLYLGRRFDAAVIYGIVHRYSLEETELLLQEIGEKPLCRL